METTLNVTFSFKNFISFSLLAGYITVKWKTHFCSRNDFQKSYGEDHRSDIEMTIAETNVDVNWKLVLYQISQRLFR